MQFRTNPPLLLLLPFLLFSCGDGSGPGPAGDPVTLYCALDQVHSSVLVQEFEKATGIGVRAIYDKELTKTVGLVQNLVNEAQAGRVRCDVFWNNEIVNTIKLQKKGLLAPYAAPSGADLPARWRDPEHYWAGFAARARVFIVNTRLLPDPKKWPRNLEDLAAPRWRGKPMLARPRTGTTLTHFAALYDVWGAKRLKEFCGKILANQVRLAQGNAHVMRQVSDGKAPWGLTDTDDFNVARVSGKPVAMVYPDQGEGMGTMVIPNTVCLIKDGPQPEKARKLIDFILSRRVEEKLAHSKSAQIPVRAEVGRPGHVKSPSPTEKEGCFKAMPWDPVQVGTHLDGRARELAEIFSQ